MNEFVRGWLKETATEATMNEADGYGVFQCPQCHAQYRSAYRISITVQTGRFDCVECETPLHTWSGVRNYFQWERS
jgi:transcription elongation factor Elf1